MARNSVCKTADLVLSYIAKYLYVKLPSSLCSEDLHTSDSRCFSEDIAIGRCSPSADSFF